MNAQAIKENTSTAPVAAQGAAVDAYPVALLDTDGKVIISTLPSAFASGADLFAPLFPADRQRLALDVDELQTTRFLFSSREGGFFLLTASAGSHGIILAVRFDAVRSDKFKATASQYGFEELICRDRAEDHSQNHSEQVSSALSFVLSLDRLFSGADGASLTSKRSAQNFLCRFSSLASVQITVEHHVGKKAPFEAVDCKALGLAALFAGALSASLFGRTQVSVSFFETADHHSVKVEFSVKFDPKCTLDLPSAESLEELLGSILAFKCKNIHVRYADSSFIFSLCPAVFDPDAKGLMQGNGIQRTNTMKGLKK